MSSAKSKTLSSQEVMIFCIKEYLNEANSGMYILSFVIISIVLKKLAYAQHEKIMHTISKKTVFGDAVLWIFCAKVASVILGGFTDFLIEYAHCTFRTSSSVKALDNILKSEMKGNYCLESGRTQYYMEQGSKGISKMIKIIFVDIFSKAAYLLVDLYRITNGFGRYYTISILFFVAIAMSLHMLFTFRMLYCKKNMNDSKGTSHKNLYETLSSYNTIKSYQTEDLHINRFREKQEPWAESYIYYKTLSSLLYISQGVLFAIASLILNFYTFKYVANTDGNKLRNLYSMIHDCDKTISNVSGLCRKLLESLLDSRLIIQYISAITEESYNRNYQVDYFHSKLELKNVSFQYENRVILNNISFTLNRGDKVVIYGKNGVGKTTLFNILMRFNEYQGLISLDNVSIVDFDMKCYRSLITYVPQDTILFDDTVFNNLTYGNDRSFHEVIEECKNINIHEQILRLPNGYNTAVGERGKNINGGLRQLIFYTRAFLRDSCIYLFDEPTNNLDQAAASLLVDYLLSTRFSSKTFLAICHDYEMVAKFPRIFSFRDNGMAELIDNKS